MDYETRLRRQIEREELKRQKKEQHYKELMAKGEWHQDPTLPLGVAPGIGEAIMRHQLKFWSYDYVIPDSVVTEEPLRASHHTEEINGN